MSRRTPCRFYSRPGGCKRADCHFAHIASPSQGLPPAAGTPIASSGTRPFARTADVTASTGAPVPYGTCAYYWRTGECNRGFSCRYKHDRSPNLQARSSTRPTAASVIAPFLARESLGRLFDAGSDALFSSSTKPRSPTDVHNSLKRFLFDAYAFRHVPDIYAFLSLLGDATSNNSSWVIVYPSFMDVGLMLCSLDGRRRTGARMMSSVCTTNQWCCSYSCYSLPLQK